MTMQIDRIALYSTTGEIRTVQFRTGAVNIITGKSRTGKSAIIDILDYCLGRSTYTVFEGVNRYSVAWYAVVLQVDNAQVLLAKPAPEGDAKSQSRVFMDTGTSIVLPPLSELIPNSNDAAVTSYLSRLLGISPNKTEPGLDRSSRSFEATIDHTKFYLFQEQGLVANRKLLFHRQDEQFIPQSIRDTLPYFVGAVQEHRMDLMQRLRDAKRQLAMIRRRLTEAEAVVQDRYAQAQSLIAEAREVGILQGTSSESMVDMLAALRAVAGWNATDFLTEPTDELGRAQRTLHEAQNVLATKLREIRETESYLQNALGYGREAELHAGRLEAVLLIKDSGRADVCPVCESHLETPPPTVKAITDSLEQLHNDLEGMRREEPRLAEHLGQLRNELDEQRIFIRDAKAAVEALLTEREEAGRLRDRNARAARVAGRVSMYVENIDVLDENAGLRLEEAEAFRRVEELSAQLAPDEVEELMASFLRVLSTRMSKSAETLKLEFAGSPYRFDEKRLTVVADTPEIPIPMDRQGSAENWLGCHLILLLALHEQFIRRERPVPNFLVLDQPSQVYFPSQDSYRALEGEQVDLAEIGADVLAVQRMFTFLFDAVEALSPHLQIIVMEHANLPDERFQEALVEEPWRGDLALIPREWLV